MLVFVKFRFESCCIGFGSLFFFFTRQKPVLALGNWVQASAVTYLLCSLWQGIFAYFHLPFGSSAFSVKGCPSKDSCRTQPGP